MSRPGSALARAYALVAAGLSIIAPAGCSTGVDRNIEHLVTIASGIYGQTTETNDVGRPETKYISMTLSVYGKDGALVASERSGRQGFYEFQLAAGAYRLCTSFRRCTDAVIAGNQKLRCDYDVGADWLCGDAD
jgi:hypothetical protein